MLVDVLLPVLFAFKLDAIVERQQVDLSKALCIFYALLSALEFLQLEPFEELVDERVQSVVKVVVAQVVVDGDG